MKAKRMIRDIKIPVLILILFLLYSGTVYGLGVSIIYMRDGIQALSFMGPDQMMPHATRVRAMDPNFSKDGLQTFEGIDLKTLMKSVPADEFSGVTVVGTDQYVGYIPYSRLNDHQVLLAWRIDESLISSLKGGPLKIIYSSDEAIHPNCYTWYVDAIFTDNFQNSELIIEYPGQIRRISQKELDHLSDPIENSSVSTPPGCPDFYSGVPGNFTAVKLKKLLPPSGTRNTETIEFVPWVGAGVTINTELIEDHVLIVSGMGKKGVPPIFGGPFSVMFPIETHVDLIGKVPESGALFFLKKIVIK